MSNLQDRTTAAGSALFTPLGHDTHDREIGKLTASGTLPEELNGVLFRNGPGKFNRGGKTKRTVLDGDGVIQRLEFAGGLARYSRRFVRTPKFVEEEAADRFLSPTWTTLAPGLFTNVGQHIKSQAGVTTYTVRDALMALDEGGSPAFEIDPVTLATLHPASLGLPDDDASPKAHAKLIAETGDWLFASTRIGREMSIDLVRHRADGSRIATPTVISPRISYVHDFAATNNYAIFVLQAVRLQAIRFLTGLGSFTECLEWSPNDGNMVLLIDLATGSHQVFEAPPAWNWHMGNAYEHGDDVVVDFVGYDDPGHFLGPDAQLAAVMRCEQGVNGAPGTIRRYVLSRNGRLAESVLADGNFEFPSIDWRAIGSQHRRLYATTNRTGGMLHTGIAALDTETGTLDCYDFGPSVNAGEPVFAADPRRGRDEGWLITQTLDLERGTSGFSLLDAQNVAAGPVATVELGETMPISFHGQWVAA